MRCESLGTSFSCAVMSVPDTRRARAGSTYFITSVYARTSDVASAWTFRYDRQVALRPAPRVCTPPFLGSSMAEHPAVNRRVAGSSPARGANSLRKFDDLRRPLITRHGTLPFSCHLRCVRRNVSKLDRRGSDVDCRGDSVVSLCRGAVRMDRTATAGRDRIPARGEPGSQATAARSTLAVV